MVANLDNQIVLKDGRKLGYAEIGDPAGTPVIHFHGVPDSRLEGTLPGIEETARWLGTRLILPDRPGFGLSDYKPGRTYLDWPDDVIELADQLGLAQFAVIGVSGGGPYTAACAYKIPQRVTRAGIVSGVGPLDMPGAKEFLSSTSDGQAVALGARSPFLLRLLVWYTIRQFRKNADDFVEQIKAEVSPADRSILDVPEIKQTAIRMMAGAFQQGARGVTWDYVLISRPWGFKLEEIGIPVFLWHGEADTICSVSMGRYVAGKIPNCTPRYYPDEGHYSLIIKNFEEILTSILA